MGAAAVVAAERQVVRLAKAGQRASEGDSRLWAPVVMVAAGGEALTEAWKEAVANSHTAAQVAEARVAAAAVEAVSVEAEEARAAARAVAARSPRSARVASAEGAREESQAGPLMAG